MKTSVAVITICHVESGKPLLRSKRTSLEGVTLDTVDLRGADFRKQNLAKSTFISCNFSGARFSRANMQGMRMRNCVLRNCVFTETALGRVNVADSVFDKSTFKKAKLERGIWIRVKFHYCSFWDIYGISCDFSFSDCSDSDFRYACLTTANFCDADLSRCDFTEADLRQANMTHATIDNATFAHAKMVGSIGVNGQPWGFTARKPDKSKSKTGWFWKRS